MSGEEDELAPAIVRFNFREEGYSSNCLSCRPWMMSLFWMTFSAVILFAEDFPRFIWGDVEGRRVKCIE